MDAYSHTARQDYMTCPRKFYLGRMLRLEKERDPAGLRMGKAQANAIEEGMLLATQPLAIRQAAAYRSIETAYEEIRKAAPSGDWDKLLLEEAQLKVLAPAYLARYPAGKLIAELGGTHAVTHPEVPFDDPILGPGRLDGIVAVTTPKGIRTVGVEDKLLTPGFWRNADEKALAINAQVTAYFAAMRAAGNPLDELRYRVTFKPSIKPDSRKRETLTDYIARLTARVVTEEGYAFREYRVFRSDEQLDAFIARTQQVHRMIRRSKLDLKRHGDAAFPGNLGTSCTLYGECEFLDLCSMGMSATGYRVKPKRPKLTARQVEVLTTVGESFTSNVVAIDVARQSGLTVQQARTALDALVGKDLVAKQRDGRRVVYALTAAGKNERDRG
jgi:predicted transcriptional regulator